MAFSGKKAVTGRRYLLHLLMLLSVQQYPAIIATHNLSNFSILFENYYEMTAKVKVKIVSYSRMSTGLGADASLVAVNDSGDLSHKPGSRLPLFPARLAPN